jgi:hypothetical protein
MTDQAIRVVAAGWYTDPADGARVRWWNGVAWTEHTNARPDLQTASVVEAVETSAPTAATASADAHPRTRREAIAAEGGRAAPDVRRSTTGVVWLIALLPVIAFVLALGAFYVYFYVVSSLLVVLVAVVPYLLGLLWALSDSRQLAARGFRRTSPLWALLTPLGYLIVRRLRVPGSRPLVLFVVTAVLTVLVPLGFWATGAARVVTTAVQVQHAAVSQLVDTGKLGSVSCPPVIESLTPGTLFTCTATTKDGTPTQVWVSIDDVAGTFSIAPAL